MSLVPFLIAGKIAKEKSKTHHTKTQPTYTETQEPNNYNVFEDETKLQYAVINTLFNCDEETIKILDKLTSNIEGQITTEDQEKQKLLQTAFDLETKLSELKVILKKFGVVVSQNNHTAIYWSSEKKLDGKLKFVSKHPATLLNDIELSLEDVLLGKNPFYERFDTYRNLHKNNDVMLNNAQKKYEKLSKQKLMLKISKSKQLELQELAKEIERLKAIEDTMTKYRMQATSYSTLYDHQIGFIQEYLKTNKELFEISKQLEKIYEQECFKQGYYLSSNQEYEKFKNTTINNSLLLLSKDELEKVRSFICKLAKNLYGAEKQDLKDLTQFAKLENTEISTNFLIEFLVKELKNELKTLKNESENKIIY